MTERTLGEEIEIIARDEISKLPYNETATIIHSYEDGYSDIQLNNGSILKYIQTIGDNSINNTGLLTYTNNNYNTPIFITGNNGLRELIGDIEADMNR